MGDTRVLACSSARASPLRNKGSPSRPLCVRVCELLRPVAYVATSEVAV